MTDEKPFPCSSPGCSMRFANEDHLSIHKKRHMSLSIESNSGAKTPNFVADETPTPTRFIRNCEEVGLFQDLNVNPFDEQFRRAAEVTEKTGLLAPSAIPLSDDVLHTPHVFPMPPETEAPAQLPPPRSANVRKSYFLPSLSTSECLSLPSPVITPLISVTAPTESSNYVDKEEVKTSVPPSDCDRLTPIASNITTLKKDRIKKNNSSNSVPNKIPPVTSGVTIMPRPPVPSSASASDPLTALLLRLPDGRLVQIPTIPLSSEADTSVVTKASVAPLLPAAEQRLHNSQPTCSSKPVLSETKLKLKQVLAKSKAEKQPVNVISPSVASDTSGTDTEPIANSDSVNAKANHSRSERRRRSYNSASDPDLDEEESEKRRKFLERNRAAAFRSRQKRKRWVTNLEAKTTLMNNANRMLQNEVISLRSEVAQLKLQLLAHKDCPVTLALCQKNTFNANQGESGRIPVNLPSSDLSATSVLPNTTIASDSSPRQIIILNTSSSNPTTLPIITKMHSPVTLQHPPLIVVPRAETLVSQNPNITVQQNTVDISKQTSVIMSKHPTSSQSLHLH